MDYNDLFNQIAGWIIVIVLWSMVWKGLALWRSARLNQKAWFIVLLIINTAGILEIIYLLMTQKQVQKPKAKPEMNNTPQI